MRSLIWSGLLLLAMAVCVLGQTATLPKSSDSSTAPAASAPPDPMGTPYVRPSGKQRFKWYIDSMFGPVTLGKTVALAGIETWRDSPEEWGPHWDGFGKRVASGLGKGVIKNSIQFGLDEALTLDSHYYRSSDKSVSARVKNALISPVTARDRNGHRVIGVPRLVGTYASSIIAAETWYPSRYTWKDGLKNGTYSIGFSAAFNLFKEFVWKK